MDRFVDGELRQHRAIAAMQAVEDLCESSSVGATIDVERMGALLTIVFEAARDAMPAHHRMLSDND